MERVIRRKISIKKECFPAACVVLCGFFLLRDAEAVKEGIGQALNICAGVIIPSLFPFMVLSQFVCTSGLSAVFGQLLRPLTKLLRLPAECGSILLMALIGGYPAASRSIALLVKTGRITPKTAARMLCFCVNAGPSFLIGAVGAVMLANPASGAVLYGAQVLSVLTIGLIAALYDRRRNPAPAATDAVTPIRTPYSTVLVRSVTGAAYAVFAMCAFVILFGALIHYLQNSGALAGVSGFITGVLPFADTTEISALLAGLLEVTAGSAMAASSGGMTLLGFLASFGGISVMMQVSEQFADLPNPVPMKPFILSRPVHGLLTAGFVNLLLHFFPDAQPVAEVSYLSAVKINSESLPVTLSLLLLISVFLVSLPNSEK